MALSAKRSSLLLAVAAVAALAGFSARAEETGLSGLWLLTHGQFGKPDGPSAYPGGQGGGGRGAQERGRDEQAALPAGGHATRS